MYDDWSAFFDVYNVHANHERARSEFTLAKRGADHALTSLARGDIEGVISGTAHFTFGVVTGGISVVRTGIAISIDITNNLLGAFGIKL